jgi:hypothetical protein
MSNIKNKKLKSSYKNIKKRNFFLMSHNRDRAISNVYFFIRTYIFKSNLNFLKHYQVLNIVLHKILRTQKLKTLFKFLYFTFLISYEYLYKDQIS